MKKGSELRKARIRAKVMGTDKRPRLSIFRSNKFLYAQVIDDSKRQTLASVSEKNLKTTQTKKQDKSKELGLALAKKALDKKIKKVVFDRGSYRYHGRVKAFADGAREGGLEF